MKTKSARSYRSNKQKLARFEKLFPLRSGPPSPLNTAILFNNGLQGGYVSKRLPHV